MGADTGRKGRQKRRSREAPVAEAVDRQAFYSRVFNWVVEQLKASPSRPRLIGLSAPQGAGKTTLARELVGALAAKGLTAVSLSIDDFYLTRAEQIKLAQRYPDNPYLQQRGYPGTHDIELGLKTLRALKNGERVSLPSYDKSAHGGQGDRRPNSQWPTTEGPVDLVILDGWMLGFQKRESVTDPHLAVINDFLPSYQAWIDLLEAFIWLEPEDYHDVLKWRVEAEERMAAEGRPGMTRPQIEAYIAKFLPAYKLYLSTIRPSVPTLHLKIGANRIAKV